MVWPCTLHGLPSPHSLILHWFSTCGEWTAAPQPQRLYASSLERWLYGKSSKIFVILFLWQVLSQICSALYIFACRFILENWVLDRWVRNILTVYPVVIVALVGNIWKHYKPADPSANSVFMGKFLFYYLKVILVLKLLKCSLVVVLSVVLLVLVCILLLSRVCTVIWRNSRRPLHSPGSAQLMISPLDTRHSRIFT